MPAARPGAGCQAALHGRSQSGHRSLGSATMACNLHIPRTEFMVKHERGSGRNLFSPSFFDKLIETNPYLCCLYSLSCRDRCDEYMCGICVTHRVISPHRINRHPSSIHNLPDMTMAEKTERWQLRATISVSPGPAQAITAAWIPEEQPLTRNQVRSAPIQGRRKLHMDLEGSISLWSPSDRRGSE